MTEKSDEEQYPTPDEQRTFVEAELLAERLQAEFDFDQGEIGKGLLTSALSQLRRSVGNEATAELLYEAADDYAVRDRA